MLRSHAQNGRVRFQYWELDLINHEIIATNGTAVPLKPTEFKVLICLVNRAGNVVEKNQIIDEVWGSDRFVDINNLGQAINALRDAFKTLGYDRTEFIETVRGRGYKFLLLPLAPEVPRDIPLKEMDGTGNNSRIPPETKADNKPSSPSDRKIAEELVQTFQAEDISEKPAPSKHWQQYFGVLLHYPLRYPRRLWEITRHPFRFSDSIREHPRVLLFELIWFFPATLGIIWILKGSILWSAIEILVISGLLAAAWRLVRGAASFPNDATFLLYLAATLWLMTHLAWFIESRPLKSFTYSKLSAIKTALASATTNCLRFKDFEYCVEQAKTKAASDSQQVLDAKLAQWTGDLFAATFVVAVFAGMSIAAATLRRRNRTGAWRTIAALLLFIALEYGWLVVRTVSHPKNRDAEIFELVATLDCGQVINVPYGPALNPGPLMYSGTPGTPAGICGDLPLIDVRNLKAKDRDARWSADSNEHAKGIHAQRGETISVYVYIDNGARQDLPNPNIATDLILRGSWRTSEDGTSIFSVNVSSSNAPSISSQSLRYGGDAVVTVPAGARLEQIKNSTTLCLDKKDTEELFKWSTKSEGHCSRPNQTSVVLPDTLFQTGIGIGDLKPGYDHAAVVQTQLVAK